MGHLRSYPENDLENILTTIHDQFDVLPTAEITIEANPGTVSQEYLKNIHALGVNRISLGMQSANQNELTLLERQHSFEDVMNAVEWAEDSRDRQPEPRSHIRIAVSDNKCMVDIHWKQQ